MRSKQKKKKKKKEKRSFFSRRNSGRLVGVISASDFLRMRRDTTLHEWDNFFADLKEPVSTYLNRRNMYFPGTFSKTPITVQDSDTVHDVLNKFNSSHVHRLFVVDGSLRPVGVWSLSDIIEVFLRYTGVKKVKKNKDKKDKKDKKKSKAKK
jgi:CBS domain-containing protein